MSPEYDEATTTVCGPAELGQLRRANRDHRHRRRGAASAATTSPAIAEPPMPQNAIDVIPSASGERSRREAERVALAAVAGRRVTSVEHPARVGGAQRRGVVEDGHRPFALALPGRGLLGLVDQHHGDAVADRVAIAARPADEDLLGLAVVELTPIVRADQDLEQLGVECSRSVLLRLGSVRGAPRSSPRRSSSVLASTFSRRSGSVLLGRTLNHQSSNSTVRPSVRSWRPPRVRGGDLLDLGRPGRRRA